MSVDLDELLDDARTYRSTAVVHATRLDAPRTWRTPRGSSLAATAGDWVVTDGAQEWTVAAGVFERSYRELPDGTFSKIATVCAVRLRHRVDVPTLEGSSTAQTGDWLLRGVDGELWPVSDQYFRTHYAPG